MLSKVGVYPGKPNRGNEDSGASLEVAGHPGVWLFAVFDGHGPAGAECSRLALEKVRAGSLLLFGSGVYQRVDV